MYKIAQETAVLPQYVSPALEGKDYIHASWAFSLFPGILSRYLRWLFCCGVKAVCMSHTLQPKSQGITTTFAINDKHQNLRWWLGLRGSDPITKVLHPPVLSLPSLLSIQAFPSTFSSPHSFTCRPIRKRSAEFPSGVWYPISFSRWEVPLCAKPLKQRSEVNQISIILGWIHATCFRDNDRTWKNLPPPSHLLAELIFCLADWRT